MTEKLDGVERKNKRTIYVPKNTYYSMTWGLNEERAPKLQNSLCLDGQLKVPPVPRRVGQEGDLLLR